MRRPSPSRSTNKNSSRLNAADLRPISHHLAELRRRLFWVVGSVLVAATGAVFVQQQLVRLLLRPTHGQQFIYTSPGGGIGFLFTICLYVGLIASLPVMTYHLVRFIEPALPTRPWGAFTRSRRRMC
jgi:sec-independent protein translocase protein TatC